jgi:hypothetical protein
MSLWALALSALVLVLIAYVLFGRSWLKQRPWAQGFFAAIEPVEIALWSKSETILWARLKMLTGIVLTILTQAQVIDITPLLPFIPDQYDGLAVKLWAMLPMLITLMGVVDEKLRRDVTKPLEVVALPEAVLAQPAVAVQVAKAADANDAVVAAAADVPKAP